MALHRLTGFFVAAALLTGLFASPTAASAAPMPDLQPHLYVQQASLTFAQKQLVGTTSAPMYLYVGNDGTAPLHMTSVTASGDFDIQNPSANPCPDTIQTTGHGSCVVNVVFKPTASGVRSGAVTFTSDATNSPTVIDLAGTGSNEVMQISPTSHDFGTVLTDEDLAGAGHVPEFRVTITNIGPDTFHILVANPGGTGGITCYLTNYMLAPGQSCDFNIYFQPLSSGSYHYTKYFSPDTVQGETHGFTIIGIGATPEMVLSATSHDFGEQSDFLYSDPFHVTVTNTGDGALLMDDAYAATGFPIENDTCKQAAVPPFGGTCGFDILFRPLAPPASYSGQIQVVPRFSRTQLIDVTGVGVEPAVNLAFTSLDMGTETVGTTGDARTETITNTGSADLHVTSIASGSGASATTNGCAVDLLSHSCVLSTLFAPAAAGTGGGDFAVSANTCATILPGHSCTFAISFAPTAVGTRSGGVTISDDARGGRHKVTLRGKGIAARKPARPKITSPGKTLLTRSTALTFAWGAAHYAVSYHFQISRSSTFQTTVVDQTGMTSRSYAASLTDGLYYVRVQGINVVGGAGSWSSVRKVTIDSTPPAVPSFKSVLATNSRPTLNVTGSGDTVLYQYEVWSGGAPLFSATAKKPVYKFPASHALKAGPYQWRVRATDKAGNTSAWSALFDLLVP